MSEILAYCNRCGKAITMHDPDCHCQGTPNEQNARQVGQMPDLSSLSEEDRQRIPAIHSLMPDEVGKVPVVDDIFYEGHVGFYAPEKAEEAKQKAINRREQLNVFWSRCLVVATIGSRDPEILSIRRPDRKFRMEIIDHSDKDRGIGAYTWKGYKWPNLQKLFVAGIIDVEKYDYFWFPDDDVQIDIGAVHSLFLRASIYKARLCQPSMAWNSSNIGWPVTKHVPMSMFRHTNFVEVLAPCFSREALKICLPHFDANYASWGLDFVWAKLLGYLGMGVIDAIQMRHTGVGTSGAWVLPDGRSPREEMHTMLARYGLDYETCKAGVGNL